MFQNAALISALFLSSSGCSSPVDPSATAGETTSSSPMGGAFAIWPEPDWPSLAPINTAADQANPWLELYGPSNDQSPKESLSNRASTAIENPASEATTSPGDSSKGSLPSPTSPETTTPPETRFQLYFSFYKEGSGSDKRLGILNQGPDDARLVDCVIHVYNNGASTIWRTYPLSGDLAVDNEHHLCTQAESDAQGLASTESPPITTTQACAQMMSTSFNGNDALTLSCGEKTHDTFGIVGNDPGTAWSTKNHSGSTISTKDTSLRRCFFPNSSYSSALMWLKDWHDPTKENCPTAIGAGGAGTSGAGG
ncbi:MAG: hypothetical protein MK135_12255 [Polyangiaceae bacterium]|nr:hypothetical protein [Polyangiaceae bacterium]